MEDQNLQNLKDLAWRDFIAWAFCQDQIRADFERLNGFPPPLEAKSPLDAMIDEACGVREKYFKEFSIWATAYIRGIDHAPLRMQQEWKERKRKAD